MKKELQPIATKREIGQINLAPTVHVLNATHLNMLIDIYIDACRVRLEHQVTVNGYYYQLEWFKRWWQDVGPLQSWLLSATDFILFERYLRHVKSPSTHKLLAYNTRKTVMKRMGEMFRWAQNAGYLDRDYTTWIVPAQGGAPDRKAASLTALQRLLAAASKPGDSDYLRNRAIIAMLMGMGLRRAELSHLDIDQVVIHADCSGHANVVGKKTRANPNGTRQAAFDAPTGEIIIEYLDDEHRYRGPLFVGVHGKRLTGQGIYKLVKKAIARAELEEEIIGPHDLRRAFSTHWARHSPGPDAAHRRQLQLGHASYEQTSEYTLLDVDDIRIDIVSPLALFPKKSR